MGIVESKLKLYMTRCIKTLEMREIKEEYLLSLIESSKKFLYHFDTVLWKEKALDEKVLKIFEAMEKNDRDIYSVATMFIVISDNLDVIGKYSLRYIREVAEALTCEEILPCQYRAYLRMFLDDELYERFMNLDSDEMVDVIFDVVMSVPFESISAGNYKDAKVVIEKSRKFSVSLGECHSFEDVGEVFSKYDLASSKKRIVDMFRKSDAELNSFAFGKVLKEITDVENEFDGDRDDLAKIVFDMVFRFYYECVLGLEIIENDSVSDSMYVYIDKILKKNHILSDGDESFRKLEIEVRRILRNYDENRWRDDVLMRELFDFFDLIPDGYMENIEKLISFVLVVEYRDLFDEGSVEDFIYYLAHVFVSNEVSIANFDKYIDLFTVRPAWNSLLELEPYSRIDCLLGLVEDIDICATKDVQMKTVMRVLEEYTGRSFYSLAAYDHSSKKIYELLKKIMNDERYTRHFDEDDFRVLEDILCLERQFDDELIHLVERVSRVEVRGDMRVVYCVKRILKCVRSYKDAVKRGWSIIKNVAKK